MISALLPIALAVPALAGSDAPPSDVAGRAAHDASPVVALVREHALRVVNPAPAHRVLVVSDPETGGESFVPLAPGADLTFPLYGELARGLTFEVVTVGPLGPRGSGEVALDLAALGADGPTVVLAGGHACAWELAELLPLAEPGAAMPLEPPAPAASTAACACSPMLVLAHVPVVVPAEGGEPSEPPRLEDEPLPVF